MMKSLLLMLLLLNYSSLLNSCENPDSEQSVRLTMVDPDATAETKALYANLWLFQQKGLNDSTTIWISTSTTSFTIHANQKAKA